MEYLVTMTTHVPNGTAEEVVQDTRRREAARSRELATQGHLLRLWRPYRQLKTVELMVKSERWWRNG